MISESTKTVLKFLIDVWHSTGVDESAPEEREAFRVPVCILEGVLAREDATHEDLRLVAKFARIYPSWGYSTLLSLADAEKDGRKVFATQRADGAWGWVIEPTPILCDNGEGFVYFVQCGKDGPIKIGWSTNVKKRIEGLQTGNPSTLKLLATCKGTAEDEKELHGEFSLLRISNSEWFRPHDDLLGYIERLREKAFEKQIAALIQDRA